MVPSESVDVRPSTSRSSPVVVEVKAAVGARSAVWPPAALKWSSDLLVGQRGRVDRDLVDGAVEVLLVGALVQPSRLSPPTRQ